MKPAQVLMRIEGAAVLTLAIFQYARSGFAWIWFIVLFLSIDLFMIGYVHNNKTGAWVYNLGHALVLPIASLILGLGLDINWLEGLAYIWFAHIGLDRLFGFGLKHETSFHDTHLGKIGKRKRA